MRLDHAGTGSSGPIRMCLTFYSQGIHATIHAPVSMNVPGLFLYLFSKFFRALAVSEVRSRGRTLVSHRVFPPTDFAAGPFFRIAQPLPPIVNQW